LVEAERFRGVVLLRAVEFRFCVLAREPVPLDRELEDAEAELPLRDRLEVERFFAPLLEFLDGRLVCWAILMPSLIEALHRSYPASEPPSENLPALGGKVFLHAGRR
jgi:hypothetical protein